MFDLTIPNKTTKLAITVTTTNGHSGVTWTFNLGHGSTGVVSPSQASGFTTFTVYMDVDSTASGSNSLVVNGGNTNALRAIQVVAIISN